MKNIFRLTPIAFFLGAVSLACGAVPALTVTVSDAGGKVAFKGATNSSGLFATTNLKPGSYIVTFNSTNAALKGNQYVLVISAGKKKVIADAVAGEKLVGDGVAMKVNVESGMKITGQIAPEKDVRFAGSPNVRLINGKRYFWVQSEVGTNVGGRWVEEGTPSARNIVYLSPAWVQKVQDHAGEGSMLDRVSIPNYYPGH